MFSKFQQDLAGPQFLTGPAGFNRYPQVHQGLIGPLGSSWSWRFQQLLTGPTLVGATAAVGPFLRLLMPKIR